MARSANWRLELLSISFRYVAVAPSDPLPRRRPGVADYAARVRRASYQSCEHKQKFASTSEDGSKHLRAFPSRSEVWYPSGFDRTRSPVVMIMPELSGLGERTLRLEHISTQQCRRSLDAQTRRRPPTRGSPSDRIPGSYPVG
jgi:hypothetical protein